MLGGPPDGTTPIDGATKRIAHQYFDASTMPPRHRECGQPGPADNLQPQKFYELTMQEVQLKLHPDYSPTTVWGFDGHVPGPLIQAKYGEPIMVRFHNHLPSVKIPQAFGIAEMTTHLHNGHTPSESDGNPVNYFNSINDTGPIDPAPGACQPAGLQGPALPERATRASGIRGSSLPVRPAAATRLRRWSRCGTTTTTSISPPRTSTRACSAATICSTRYGQW